MATQNLSRRKARRRDHRQAPPFPWMQPQVRHGFRSIREGVRREIPFPISLPRGAAALSLMTSRSESEVTPNATKQSACDNVPTTAHPNGQGTRPKLSPHTSLPGERMRPITRATAALVAAAVLPALALPAGAAAKPKLPKGTIIATIVKSWEGDVIDIRRAGDNPAGPSAGGRHARAGKCWFTTATKRTASLLPVGKAVYLLRDKNPKDQNGRWLYHAFNAKGVHVNRNLVRYGYGKAVLDKPNDRYLGVVRAEQVKAKKEKLRVWSGRCDKPAAPHPHRHPPPRRRRVVSRAAPTRDTGRAATPTRQATALTREAATPSTPGTRIATETASSANAEPAERRQRPFRRSWAIREPHLGGRSTRVLGIPPRPGPLPLR